MAKISIKVTGLDKVQAAMAKFPQEIGRYTAAAGVEVGNEILDTRGVRLYPPAGPANAPPPPYYIRGQGTQYATRNSGNSQRLGTQFYVDASATSYKTTIGNRASYAGYVVGENQAKAMGRIGWRRMYDVAIEKLEPIRAIYQGWIDKLIKDMGL